MATQKDMQGIFEILLSEVEVYAIMTQGRFPEGGFVPAFGLVATSAALKIRRILPFSRDKDGKTIL
ncbi:MAG: hypothetical protein LIO78_01875 [Clostridiales bacterium]|nr:hypothetical protein [Clostridiales bacterium]MCC8098803.1 hypothetical protein [Clostridiales bacterium]